MRSHIPASIPPNSAAQALLAPSGNTFLLGSTSTSTAATSSFRFVLNNANSGQLTQFSTTLTSGTSTDAAIALYDASGNLLQLQDADGPNGPANESLAIALQSGQQYTVEFFAIQTSLFFTGSVTLNITPGPQTTDSLTLNPSTGSASLTNSSLPDAFTSSSNVRYFLLNLLDANSAASVQLLPASPDTAVVASLFDLNNATGIWQPAGSTTLTDGSASATIPLSEPSGVDLNDLTFELAVAPQNFTSSPEPVTISLSTSSFLAPTTANPASLAGAMTPQILAGSMVGGTADGTISNAAPQLYSIQAPLTGQMTVQYQPLASYAPLLSVYGSGGSQLLAASASTAAESAVFATFPVTAGSTYYLQAGVDGTAGSGTFTLSATQTYSPTALAVSSTAGSQSGLSIAPNVGAQFFTMAPSDGSNYLALQLAPDAGSTLVSQISIAGPNQSPETFTAAGPGQPVTAIINESTTPGPYDVMVSSVSGTGTATLKYVTLSVPNQIAQNQLPSASLSQITGSLSSSALSASTGQLTGLQYYEPWTGAAGLTTYAARTTGGAAVVLLHYVQNGSVLQLDESSLSSGSGAASFTDTAQTQVLHAIAAMPVSFGSGGTVQLSVTGPVPIGIGVTMVPNALPGQPPPPQGYQSSFTVAGATLKSATQLDLYTTQLPNDLSSSSTTFNFIPVDSNGPLQAIVSVLNAANVVLASGTSQPGQQLALPLTGLTAGQTLRITVTPAPGTNLGTGGYGLSMVVNTTNPLPYLVTENGFYPYSNSETPGQSYFPQNVNITTIPFGSFATGDFTSSAPYNNNGTGSIQVFSIPFGTIPEFTPFEVYTTDTDPSVNTNIRLYYLGKDASNNAEYLPLAGTAPSFDYYPADRSTVDAEVVINNVDLVPTANLNELFNPPVTIFVVVMNEQGTLGNYKVWATLAPQATTGPGTGTNAQDLIVSADNNSSQYITGQVTNVPTNNETFDLLTPRDMTTGSSLTLTVKTNDGTSGEPVTVTLGTKPPPPRVSVFLYSLNGTISGGQATFSLGQLAPGNEYLVTISSTAFPAAGFSLTVASPRTYTNPSPVYFPSPAPQDATYASGFTRLDPSPTGALSQSVSVPSGNLNAVFNVQTEGKVTIDVAYPSGSSNVEIGLYQMGQELVQTGFGGVDQTVGVLLDYTSTLNAQGLYVLTENLAPGTYYLRGTGTVTQSGLSATVSGFLPAIQSQILQFEPGTGLTTAPEASILDHNDTDGALANGGQDDATFDYNRYQTAYFAVTIPANATGQPISFTLADNDTFQNPFSGRQNFGNVSVTIWRSNGNGTYTEVGSQINAIDEGDSASLRDAMNVTATDTPVPGTQYFIGVDFYVYAGPLYVGVNVPVFKSGLPDLAQQPITLTADSGKTLVQSSVINESFTASPQATYNLQLGSVTTLQSLAPMAPFETLPIQFVWNPGSVSDQAAITIDPSNSIAELSKSNNSASIALSTVDPHAPTALIELLNAQMTAEGTAGLSTGGTTWGRYISTAHGQTATIEVVGADTDFDLYEVSMLGPSNSSSGPAFGDIFIAQPGQFPATTQTLNVTTDFGNLKATSASNLNQIQFFALDEYGLRTPTYVQTLDVAAPPHYLTGGLPGPTATGVGGSITFNPTSYTFTYTWTDNIINDNDDVNQLVGNHDPTNSLPLVGNLPDQLLVAVNGNGTSTLSPAENIAFTISGHVLLELAGAKIFDQTYTGASVSNVTFNAQLVLSGETLEMLPSSESLSLQLNNLKLFSVSTPTAPLFAIGIPDVIGVQLGLKYSLTAALSAGVKLGPDPADNTATSYLDSLGVMSPSFIEPSLTGTASLVGSVNFAGFDIASITGSAGITLSATVGLDNSDPNKVFSFDSFFDNLAFDIDAKFTVGLAISVPIIGNVYSLSQTINLGNIVNTVSHGIFLTDPPSTASGKFIAPGGDNPSTSYSQDATTTTISGSSLVGAYAIDPTPQIVINNSVSGGMGLSIQLVNAGTASAPLANMAFSTRTGGSWSTLSTLSEGNDVSDPTLALTHDGSGAPGVVVYDADKVAGSPANQTINQRLDDEGIRYRYFNGTTWGSEIGLTNDSLYDGEQSIAFNSAGAGVLAYVHNTDSNPVGSTGAFDNNSNDIEASLWNPTTHTFGTPVAITAADGVADSSPATFVDASGTDYIVWIRATSSGNELMYSRNSGSGWSSPAVLGVSGLPANGVFNSVAMGSDGTGRVDVLFSYSVDNPDGTISTTLFNRPSTTTSFAALIPAVQLAGNSNFSGLRTATAPSGALVAYWEQSDGQINQIFETTISNGTFTAPTQVTDDPNVASEPSAAIDNNGTLQVLYDNNVLYGGTSQGSPTDPQVGVPMADGVASSNVQNLPQLTFTSGLAFPSGNQTYATIGSQVTATAVIANRGLVAAPVTITAYDGLPGTGTVVGTQSINLLPGASYNVSQIFTILPGLQTYSLQLTTTGGQAFDTTENISSTTVTGAPDIAAISLANNVPSPQPGGTYTLMADVRNLTNASIGPFVVTLYSGDPLSATQFPVTALASQNVTGMTALQDMTLSFPVTLLAGAGADLYTVVVDSTSLITESNENNNEARYEVAFQADPAIQSPNPPAVIATLLNSGTSNNVQVVVGVENLGSAAMVNVPLDLQVSRNGGAYTSAGQILIASLAPGAAVSEVFTITALAGDNLFVASIDPSAFAQDSNLANDVGTADLDVPGLPVLSATVSLSNASGIAGGPLTLTANLSNSGLGDATNVPLVVLASLSSGGPARTIGTALVNLAGLGSQSFQISLDTTGLGVGQYKITLEIDPNQTILMQSAPVGASTTYTIVAPASISGTVFGDSNGNGVMDSGETGIAGWQVYLDENNNGSFDTGDVLVTTNPAGNYTFTGISPGSYTVRAVAVPGWGQTFPASNNGQNLTLAAGQNATGIKFGQEHDSATATAVPTPLFTGDTYTLNLAFSGAHPATSWIINWGDGTGVQTITGNPSSVLHTFSIASGATPYSISAMANCADGAVSAAPLSIMVYTAPVLSGGTLSLTGTGGNDIVSFSDTAGVFVVNFNGASRLYNSSLVTKVLYADNGGNDTITNDSTSKLNVAPASAGKTTLNALSGTTIIPANSGTGIQQLDFAAINISAGAKVVFANTNATLGNYSNHANRSLAIVDAGGLNIASGGILDIGDNSMLLKYAPGNKAATDSMVSSLLTSGFDGGAWSGTGITSSEANFDAFNGSASRAVGWADQNDVGVNSFEGDSADVADGNEIMIKFTYYGDTDLDGKVASSDSANFSTGVHLSGNAFWEFGDFDYSGGKPTASDSQAFSTGLAAYKTFGQL